ncbi:glycosyltransferase [Ligilactobacillus equi]
MIFFIVILYNKCIDDSDVLEFFKNRNDKNDNICIFDNSQKDYGNRKVAEARGWIYISKGKNVGISKAYNFSIRKIIEEFNAVEYFMMLDDDSSLNEEYLNYVTNYIQKHNFDIAVPIVESNNLILSPCNVNRFGRITQMNKVSNISQISAINNGMVIRKTVFDVIMYNENLFVDYVDHDFCRKAREHSFKIDILDYKLKHNMSVVDNTIPFQSRLQRFRIYVNDLKIYYSQSILERVFCMLHLCKMGFKYCVQYKSLKFIQLIFSQ